MGVLVKDAKRSIVSKRTLANILPPDIVDSTRPAAVNTFSLVLSDDNVGNRCSRFQDEHSVSFAGFSLFLAYAAFK